MNYQKIYDSIIYRAKQEELSGTRKRKNGNYYERHHIVPKCLGGSDNKSNIVLLTAKEHFISHKLLCEMYPDNDKLKYAIWVMSNTKRTKRYIPSGILYERIRNEIAIVQSKARSGYVMSESTKQLLREINTGKKSSEATRKKISDSKKGKPKSEITRQRMTKPKPIVTCPYCGTSGGQNSMTAWHFDNCRSLPGNEHIHDKRLNTLHTCSKCGFQSKSLSNMKRYHFDNCGKPADLRTCPHCGKTANARNAVRWHFDNCREKNLDT
jgi:ribosomal protein L32